MIKIITFNINGINSFTKYIEQKYNLNFNNYLLQVLKVDILCLQEIKTKIETNLNLKDYITFTNLNKYKNGVYGVSTIVRKTLYCRKHNFTVPFSDYGRSILTDHKTFKLLNLYFPVGGNDLKLIFNFYEKIKRFISQFDDLIVVGDFNAVYSVFDHFIYYNEYLNLYNIKELTECVLIEKEEIIFEKEDSESNETSKKFVDSAKNKSHKSNEFNNEKIIFYTNEFSKTKETTINNDNFKENWKILNFNYPTDTNDQIDIYKILGDKLQYFLFSPINSPYLIFLKNSLKFLAEIKIKNINKYTKNQYNINLIERSLKSVTKLDYIIHSPSVLVLLLYGTYQRNWFVKLILQLNFIDVFRLYHENIKYTCWNTQLSLRSVNLGTRIDYILVPIKLIKFIGYSDIMDDIYGSDHCPVFVLLDIKIEDDKNNCLKIKNNLNDYFNFKKR